MTRGESTDPAVARRPPSAAEVLTYLLNRQTATRRDIAQHTGLSAAAVTKALQPMMAAGLVAETSLPRAAGLGAGRPTQQVRIVPGQVTVVGIKLTADQVIAVVTDLSGMIVDQLSRSVEPADSVAVSDSVEDSGSAQRPRPASSVSVDVVVDVIAGIVAELATRHRIDQIGVAVSGDVDTDRGIVVLSPLLGWCDVRLADRLRTRVDPPVIIDNDIRALTAAEQAFGDAFGIDTFAVVTIGEGVGCGLVVNGQVLRGGFGVAGELGHMIINSAGGQPGQGSGSEAGQLEQLISRSAVMRRSALTRRTGAGGSQRFTDLIAAAEGGDEDAAQLLRAVGIELGIGVANVINMIGPQRLVISTEGFELSAAFGSVVDETARRYAFGRAGQVEIVHREIPFSEWARGAAVVALTRRVLLS